MKTELVFMIKFYLKNRLNQIVVIIREMPSKVTGALRKCIFLEHFIIAEYLYLMDSILTL